MVEGSKSFTYTKIPLKTENFSKMVGVHSLEHFTPNTKSFQVKKLFSKKMVTLSEEAEFIYVNSCSRFVITVKTFTLSPFHPLNFLTLKICQKWFGVHILQLFPANTRWFQGKTLSSEKLTTVLKETQFT